MLLAESPSAMYFSLRNCSFLNKGNVETIDSKRKPSEDKSVVETQGGSTISKLVEPVLFDFELVV